MSTKIDLKLIPEFSGNNQQSVAEWLEKVELVQNNWHNRSGKSGSSPSH